MPEDNEILPVEIHLPGLLKLLGESLYSIPRVALRELVQNDALFLLDPATASELPEELQQVLAAVSAAGNAPDEEAQPS